MLHSRPTLVSKPLIPHLPIIYLLPLPPTTIPCSWLSFFASCPHSPFDSLRVLQWNAGGLRARSTELLHFLSCHPVDLICIQESNLNSSSSFRIPGFSALRSDCTHSRSGKTKRNLIFTSNRLVFTSKRMLPTARKDVLPAIQKSFVIYEYKCHCDSRYIGRTSQRLQDRIKQHVPKWLRQQLTRPRRS